MRGIQGSSKTMFVEDDILTALNSELSSKNSTSSLLLKRTVKVKARVTPLWKEEVQQYIQSQIVQLDEKLRQVEKGELDAIASIPTFDLPESRQQIDLIRSEATKQRAELLDKKNELLSQIQQVHLLQMESEVEQFEMESFFHLNKGESLIKKLNLEVIMRDGVVEEVRGDV